MLRVALSLALVLLPHASPAQESRPAGETRPGRGLHIRGARIVTVGGESLEGSDLIVSGGRIRHVGAPRPPRPNVRVIDGAGLTVVPAFIEARTDAFLVASDRSPEALSGADLARDGLDLYHPDLGRTLEGGVVAAFTAPRTAGTTAGRGVVIRLGGEDDVETLDDGEHVCFALGRPRSRVASTRDVHDAWKAVKKLLEDAKTYAADWTKYEEELASWEKAMKAFRTSGAESRPAAASRPAEGGSQPRSAGGGRGGRTGRVELPPEFRTWSREQRAEYLRKLAAERQGGGAQREVAAESAPADGAPPKPKKPAKDAAKDALRAVLAGKNRLRIEAHDRLAVEYALRIADEFAVPILLEGLSDAGDMADEIARRRIPALVVPGPALDATEVAARGRRADLPAVLHRAGVKVVLTTLGEGGRDVASLREQAALAVQGGLSEAEALRGVTLYAAEVLGIEDRLGSIGKDREATFVVLRGDPLDPLAEVRYVVVRGRIRHPAESE